MKLKSLTLGIVVSVLGLSVLIPATTSASEPKLYKCKYGTQSYLCARITGIDKGSWVNLWNAPNYSHGTVAKYSGKTNGGRNGYAVYLRCWTTGPNDKDGAGNRYWWKASYDDGRFVWGYLNDQYVTTGSYANWSKLAKHC